MHTTHHPQPQCKVAWLGFWGMHERTVRDEETLGNDADGAVGVVHAQGDGHG